MSKKSGWLDEKTCVIVAVLGTAFMLACCVVVALGWLLFWFGYPF